MNLFHEAKKVLDKDGKVNPLGPYGKQKLTGREISTYFRRNKAKDPQIKKAVEVALDLQGAMSVASSEIKKFYGDKILKSKEVQSALKYANESVEYDIREDLNEGSFYGQDGMAKAAKKMFNKNTHVKLVKDKGSYQSATISKTDTKKIAQLKKNGYKQVPLEDLDKEDEKTVKDVIGQLKKAVKAHSGQVKTLTKDLKDSKEVNEALIALSPKQHDILKKAGMTDAFLKKHDAYVSNKNPRGITISSPNPKFFDLVTKMSKKPAVKKQLKALKEGKLGDSIIRKDFPNVWAASAKDREILKKFHAKVDTKNYVKQKALYKKDIKGFVDSLNEVTDKEINMAKKLSKDMEKVKKGYQQIAKTGDKTLKNTGFNPTYEAILKAQQKVLSLIGELNTMKIISDRSASRKKDSKGRPIMSSNIMDSYRIMYEESMQDKLSKLFRMRDKKAIDGVANLLNMTSVKVLQSMQKQNPKGFERMAKKMGELPAMEGIEIIDEKLSREDLKLIDKMYDKKGNLTPIGKKVMEYGKKKKQ